MKINESSKLQVQHVLVAASSKSEEPSENMKN